MNTKSRKRETEFGLSRENNETDP